MRKKAGHYFPEAGIKENQNRNTRKSPTQGPSCSLNSKNDKNPSHNKFVHRRLQPHGTHLSEPGQHDINTADQNKGRCRNTVHAQPIFSAIFTHGIDKEYQDKAKSHMGNPLVHGSKLEIARIELKQTHSNRNPPDQMSGYSGKLPLSGTY